MIARSGAGTVAELMAIGRPAILVPLPGALDDNQTPNADILAKAEAGWRVAQSALTPDTLAQMLVRIFASPPTLARHARPRPMPWPRRTRPQSWPMWSNSWPKGRPPDGHATVTTRVPLDIGAIHFIGIGGIGMSGIAEIMHNLGYKVQGSDAAENANVKRLRAMGITVACRPQCRQSERRPCRGLFLGGQAGQCRVRCRARCWACRWCAGPRCWPRSCGCAPASPSPAPTARPRPRPWSPRCWMRATWTPPWSMAASSTPMAPMRGWAPANGWWWRPMKATAPSCACPPPWRW